MDAPDVPCAILGRRRRRACEGSKLRPRAVPAIYPQAFYVYGGGLMSYYPVGTLHQVGLYFVARILKGASQRTCLSSNRQGLDL
jgi:hypothetical protein